ncbi:MAG: ATP-binding protein [bacterium]
MAFRVLQEALTNAVRHAGASRIDVRLAGAAGAVVLSVVDDGAGFAVGAASEGMGLMGMRERARSQAGSLRVESAPGRGTRVVLTVPAAAGEEEG